MPPPAGAGVATQIAKLVVTLILYSPGSIGAAQAQAFPRLRGPALNWSPGTVLIRPASPAQALEEALFCHAEKPTAGLAQNPASVCFLFDTALLGTPVPEPAQYALAYPSWFPQKECLQR